MKTYFASLMVSLGMLAVMLVPVSFIYAADGQSAGPATPQSTATQTVGKIQNPINVSDFSSFIAKLLGIILRVAVPIVAAFIIYAGLMFVLARGNSEKLEKAKTRLLYTLIGAGVLLGAWMIATVIKATVEAFMA